MMADQFSSVALKYRFIFGLTKAAPVLVFGEISQRLRQDFDAHFDVVDYVDRIEMLEHLNKNYGLVYVDASKLNDQKICCHLVARINELMMQGATLLLTAKNHRSLSEFKNALRGKRMPSVTTVNFDQLLLQNKLPFKKYYIFPSCSDPEEYLDTQLAVVELTQSASYLAKALNTMGLYRYWHSDYLYIAATNSTPFVSLKKLLAAKLNLDSYTVVRFFLRDRGALIMLLADKNNDNPQYILRVACGEEVDRVIRRNQALTDKLHKLPLPEVVSSKIPRTIASCKQGEYTAYLEQKLPGTLAWKLNDKARIQQKVYVQTLEFLWAFNQATHSVSTFDQLRFDRLLGHNIQTLKESFAQKGSVGSVLESIYANLWQYLQGRQARVVIGHGDFGYGNLLCDANTGELLGVIDWDTAIEEDLFGVDLHNLLLQNSRTKSGGILGDAFWEVYKQICEISQNKPEDQGYNLPDFGLTKQERVVCLCVAVLRYICRSVPYRKEFDAQATDYEAALLAVEAAVSRLGSQ